MGGELGSILWREEHQRIYGHALKPPQDLLNKQKHLNKCTNRTLSHLSIQPAVYWAPTPAGLALGRRRLKIPPTRVESIKTEVALVLHLSNMRVTKAEGPFYPRSPVIAAPRLSQLLARFTPLPFFSHYPWAVNTSSFLFFFSNVYFGAIFMIIYPMSP